MVGSDGAAVAAQQQVTLGMAAASSSTAAAPAATTSPSAASAPSAAAAAARAARIVLEPHLRVRPRADAALVGRSHVQTHVRHRLADVVEADVSEQRRRVGDRRTGRAKRCGAALDHGRRRAAVRRRGGIVALDLRREAHGERGHHAVRGARDPRAGARADAADRHGLSARVGQRHHGRSAVHVERRAAADEVDQGVELLDGRGGRDVRHAALVLCVAVFEVVLCVFVIRRIVVVVVAAHLAGGVAPRDRVIIALDAEQRRERVEIGHVVRRHQRDVLADAGFGGVSEEDGRVVAHDRDRHAVRGPPQHRRPQALVVVHIRILLRRIDGDRRIVRIAQLDGRQVQRKDALHQHQARQHAVQLPVRRERVAQDRQVVDEREARLHGQHAAHAVHAAPVARGDAIVHRLRHVRDVAHAHELDADGERAVVRRLAALDVAVPRDEQAVAQLVHVGDRIRRVELDVGGLRLRVDGVGGGRLEQRGVQGVPAVHLAPAAMHELPHDRRDGAALVRGRRHARPTLRVGVEHHGRDLHHQHRGVHGRVQLHA